MRQHPLADPGELSGSLHHAAPLEAQPVADLSPEMSLVEEPRGSRELIERSAVQGGPPTVGAAGEVRAHDVGVQLRVERPGHPVAVARGNETCGALAPNAAPASPHLDRLVFQELQRGAERVFMRADEMAGRLVVGDREQHRHRLGRRERQVEPDDLRLTVPVAQLAFEERVGRVDPGEQRVELRSLDAPGDPQRRRATTQPHSRRLSPTGVVVVMPARDRPLVVRGLAGCQLADRQHYTTQQWALPRAWPLPARPLDRPPRPVGGARMAVDLTRPAPLGATVCAASGAQRSGAHGAPSVGQATGCGPAGRKALGRRDLEHRSSRPALVRDGEQERRGASDPMGTGEPERVDGRGVARPVQAPTPLGGPAPASSRA